MALGWYKRRSTLSQLWAAWLRPARKYWQRGNYLRLYYWTKACILIAFGV